MIHKILGLDLGHQRHIVTGVLRVLAVIGLFLLLFPHDLTNPMVLGALATLLCLLAVAELSIRDLSPDWMLGAIAGILSLCCTGWLLWFFLFPPPPMPTGPLIPAGEPTPPGTCMAGKNGMVILLGNDRVLAEGKGTMRPFLAHECPGPVLRRTPGGLMVDAMGYDWFNDIVYLIRDNRLDFLMVTGLAFYRPDRSTLVLRDRFGQEVVYVRYLNRGAVRVRGRWLCAEQSQLLIHEKNVRMGGVRIGGTMFGTHAVPGGRCAHLAPGQYSAIRFDD